jgi:acetyl esterase/lipase
MWLLGVSKYRNVASSPLIRSMGPPNLAGRRSRTPPVAALGFQRAKATAAACLGHTEGMPRAFLIASIAGTLLVLNARRAVRLQILLVPAFFASWLVIELAPHLLAIHTIGVVAFAVLGGLREWTGWIALTLSAINWYLLFGLVREAQTSNDVLEEALTEVIGPAAHTPVAWREIAFPFKLWSRRIKRVRNVPYAAPGTRRHQLDVWYTDDGSTDRPCLLYVVGGAWLVGISNKNQQGKPLLIEMASQGWVCFAMNYPLSPRSAFPAHIVAVKRAIAWIREHAHEYGGDARFLMISGNSAGGHLSSLAALSPSDPSFQPGFEDADTSVQAAAPLYGVYDFTGDVLDELPRAYRRQKEGMLRFWERVIARRRRTTDREFFERGSPWHRVGEHAPPFLIVHGTMDTLALAPEARAFAARLKQISKAPVIYAELPRTQHAFDQFLSIRTINVVRAIARFGRWAFDRWTATRDARPSQPPNRAAPSPTSPA